MSIELKTNQWFSVKPLFSLYGISGFSKESEIEDEFGFLVENPSERPIHLYRSQFDGEKKHPLHSFRGGNPKKPQEKPDLKFSENFLLLHDQTDSGISFYCSLLKMYKQVIEFWTSEYNLDPSKHLQAKNQASEKDKKKEGVHFLNLSKFPVKIYRLNTDLDSGSEREKKDDSSFDFSLRPDKRNKWHYLLAPVISKVNDCKFTRENVITAIDRKFPLEAFELVAEVRLGFEQSWIQSDSESNDSNDSSETSHSEENEEKDAASPAPSVDQITVGTGKVQINSSHEPDGGCANECIETNAGAISPASSSFSSYANVHSSLLSDSCQSLGLNALSPTSIGESVSVTSVPYAVQPPVVFPSPSTMGKTARVISLALYYYFCCECSSSRVMDEIIVLAYILHKEEANGGGFSNLWTLERYKLADRVVKTFLHAGARQFVELDDEDVMVLCSFQLSLKDTIRSLENPPAASKSLK